MAHSLSAKKRARQNEKHRMRNRSRVRAVRSRIKTFDQVARQGSDIEQIEKELKLTQKSIDKLVAQGSMHKNTAARKKSRLSRQLNALKSAK